MPPTKYLGAIVPENVKWLGKRRSIGDRDAVVG
jgi:hypothetical protein